MTQPDTGIILELAGIILIGAVVPGCLLAMELTKRKRTAPRDYSLAEHIREFNRR